MFGQVDCQFFLISTGVIGLKQSLRRHSFFWNAGAATQDTQKWPLKRDLKISDNPNLMSTIIFSRKWQFGGESTIFRHTYVSIYLYNYIYTYIHIYVYIYNIYLCIYIYAYIYIHTQTMLHHWIFPWFSQWFKVLASALLFYSTDGSALGAGFGRKRSHQWHNRIVTMEGTPKKDRTGRS